MKWHDYIDYVKDNPEGYWFKRKLYGWGWTPVTYEGWFVTLTVVAAIVFLGFRIEESASGAEVVRELVLPTVALVLLLLLICYKTGESPKWTWGIKSKDKDTRDEKEKTQYDRR